jgi:hypothetical protein
MTWRHTAYVGTVKLEEAENVHYNWTFSIEYLKELYIVVWPSIPH